MLIQPKTVALLRSLFAIDENGNVFIRVAEQEPEGDLTNAVTKHNSRSLDNLLTSAVVLDGDGNPAIRLVGVPFGKTMEEHERGRRAKMLAEKEERKAAQLEEAKKAGEGKK